MMKKNYVSPEIEAVVMNVADVITLSNSNSDPFIEDWE